MADRFEFAVEGNDIVGAAAAAHGFHIELAVALDHQHHAAERRPGDYQLYQPFGNLAVIQVGKELLILFY